MYCTECGDQLNPMGQCPYSMVPAPLPQTAGGPVLFTGAVSANPSLSATLDHCHTVNQWTGVASVQTGNKYGFIDKNGKFVINPQYDGASGFSDGLAAVTVKGKHDTWLAAYIDKTGKYVFGLASVN